LKILSWLGCPYCVQEEMGKEGTISPKRKWTFSIYIIYWLNSVPQHICPTGTSEYDVFGNRFFVEVIWEAVLNAAGVLVIRPCKDTGTLTQRKVSHVASGGGNWVDYKPRNAEDCCKASRSQEESRKEWSLELFEGTWPWC
jgi:hypothetical protein